MSRRGRPLLSWQLGCKVPGGGGRGRCEMSSSPRPTSPTSLPSGPFVAALREVQHHVPEKVPEKTPGAWLTKLSMTAPGLRERAVGAGLLPGELLLRVPQSTWVGGRETGSASGQGTQV